MWARVVCLAVSIAACYAPRVVPGTPCEPEAGCPYGLQCELVDGAHVCVDTPPGIDAAVGPDGAPSQGWQLIQTVGSDGRDVDLQPIGAGRAVIVGVESSSGGFANEVNDDAGNEYRRLNNTRARNNTENFAIELFLAVDTQPGARKITAQGGLVFAVVAWEVAGLDHADPIAVTAREDNQPESNLPQGAAITTDAPGQFVVSIAIVANSVDGIAPGNAFTNDHRTFGNGWAHLTDHSAPIATYQAQWVQPQLGGFCTTSAAFRIRP